MEAIVIAFTLKGQELKKIIPQIISIHKKHKRAVLLHGFMNRKTVVRSGYDTTLVDALYSIFPWQFNFYNPAYENPVRRDELAAVAKVLNAQVYIIGDIVDGVKAEYELYSKMGLMIEKVPLAP